MVTETNPFLRGFRTFSIRRVLLVACVRDDASPCYRELHPSQAHLTDDEVQLSTCILSNNFALITKGQEVPSELKDECPDSGIVHVVLYEIIGEYFSGRRVHIGDARSAEAARDVVTRLALVTAHYSRCLELSNTHLPATAIQHLEFLADRNVPTGLLFEVFRLPGHPAVGCELLCTPWACEPIETLYSDEPQPLRALQLSAGHPEVLVELLNLAGAAGLRYLIFDADAPTLPGLATFP